MEMRDLLIALNSRRDLKRAAVCRLGLDVEAWRDASVGDQRLATHLGVPLAQLDKAVDMCRQAGPAAAREKQRAEKLGCWILTHLDEDYPPSLRDLSLPPPVLYVRGRLPAGPAIAIVGSRRQDDYGRQAADLFAAGLAARGVVIVSGFARGVDQTAHKAAVETGGHTLAVHGCGLDIDYPTGSRPLAEAIGGAGASITEFPFGSEPRPWHFPVRNRVIAAMASGVLVVQAKERSGSLITAQLALEIGRDIFAVPGPIFDELSMGTNSLIADGAAIVRSPDDVLDHLSLGWQQELFPAPAKAPAPRRRPDGSAGRLFDALPERGGLTAEEIAATLDLAVDQTLAGLLELEIGGFIRRGPGPVYSQAGY